MILIIIVYVYIKATSVKLEHMLMESFNDILLSYSANSKLGDSSIYKLWLYCCEQRYRWCYQFVTIGQVQIHALMVRTRNVWGYGLC
jgi:hypothetical protein